MKTIWFKQLGWFYIPVHFAGFIITLLAIAFLAPVFAAIIRNGHSISDDLYDIFIYTTCTAFCGNAMRKKQALNDKKIFNTRKRKKLWLCMVRVKGNASYRTQFIYPHCLNYSSTPSFFFTKNKQH